MKKIKYLSTFIFTLLVVAGCTRENYLDFQPKGVVIPSALIDFRQLLDNVEEPLEFFSDPLSRGFSFKHSTSLYINDNQSLSTDLLSSFSPERPQVRAYLFEDVFHSSSENDADWDNYYGQIYLANVILDGLSTLDDGSTPEEIAALAAEAKVHRAYAYFNLVNLYSLHYNEASASTDLGVPIREGVALEGLDLTRPSVQAVYDLILKDITENVDNLEDTQPLDFAFRPSKAGVYGLLAKVYLHMGDYEKSLTAVDAALGFYNVLRDINTDELSTNAPLLRIHPTVQEDSEIIWFKGDQSLVFPTDELLALYDNGDLRRDWYVKIRDYSFYGDDIEESVFAAGVDLENYSRGIETPELFIIRAECHIRLGNLAQANADLNTLRIKRFSPDDYEPLSSSNQAALLTFVKEERRREMAFSDERFYDIKRYNSLDGDNISLTHTLDGTTVTLEANSNKWALPIAPKYIQQNPEIVQNPIN